LRLVQKLFTIMDSIMSEFEEFDADGIKWRYRVRDGVALLTRAEGVSESMTIPPSLGGYPVTKITDGVFEFCLGLKSVAIPDSVTSIGRYAFFLHGNLESISVDVNNPKYCSRNGLLLSKNGKTLIMGRGGEVTIPAGVTCIGDSAFIDCRGLTSVTIPDSVIKIRDWAFAGCSGLTSVTIPNSVKCIGCNAFSDCALVSAIIPAGVTSIGDCAFSNCKRLNSVTIPNSVKRIGCSAFSGCFSLASVTIPNSVTSIGDRAFSYCALTSVTIPENVRDMGHLVFVGCPCCDEEDDMDVLE
jgi:hypothetical protein